MQGQRRVSMKIVRIACAFQLELLPHAASHTRMNQDLWLFMLEIARMAEHPPTYSSQISVEAWHV